MPMDGRARNQLEREDIFVRAICGNMNKRKITESLIGARYEGFVYAKTENGKRGAR